MKTVRNDQLETSDIYIELQEQSSSSFAIELGKKIKSKQFSIGVFGAGYVGLPTAALFAEAGFKVTAVDIKPETIDLVNKGLCPNNEPGLKELISKNIAKGQLCASLDSSLSVGELDAVIFCVQTPIGVNKKPDLSFLIKAIEFIGYNMKKGMLITICSTIPPGTIRNVLQPILETSSGLKAGIDFCLSYAPERIAPGNAIQEFVENSRIIGGIDTDSTCITAELFESICKKVIRTDVATAEVSKVAENTFRDINIAYANQLAIICEYYGVDVLDVIAVANSHPRVKILNPGPGAGGPCLPKDPYLLTSNLPKADFDIVLTSRRINEIMPMHIVKLTESALKKVNKKINRSKIAVLGLAYKGDIDDSRLSPSEPLINSLLKLGANVVVYDPFCREDFGGFKVKSLIEATKNTDCIILMTDHTIFKALNLSEIANSMHKDPVVIDCRRIIHPTLARSNGFYYAGIGFGKVE
jgi:UDP-N-acetyl-D-mannosaminuronic acid dehydrogenase